MTANAKVKENSKKLNFKECTLQKLEKTFGLEQVEQMLALTEWLSTQPDDVDGNISDYDRQKLLHLQKRLIAHVHDWNEDELAFGFIAPLLSFVDYSDKKFNFFTQRSFTGIVDKVVLSGKPDGIIASGKRVPEKPYFCFQEYKREQDPEGDPAGQVLAAMLVAQELNDQEHPIYGCYVRGVNWYFIVLQGKEYCISLPYLAVREDIFTIVIILKALKSIIRGLVK
ncbi:MAG: hypothetical protein AAF639_25135 [Chloroflexota bacterium]